MRVKERALAIIESLKQEYPLADCTLDYAHAWQLLVGV
ncbi:MAG: endonuclease III, partial [Pygmaiobacter sp.]